MLIDALGAAAASFEPGELVYLGLTSKPEHAIRDRLAWASMAAGVVSRVSGGSNATWPFSMRMASRNSCWIRQSALAKVSIPEFHPSGLSRYLEQASLTGQ